MKAESIIIRGDETIRLVAEDFTRPCDSSKQFGIYAVVTDINGRIKVIDQNDARPIPKGMSVEEYKQSDLRGLFSVITYAEYFKICNLLHDKIAGKHFNFIVN
jgi:hypothetical protein